MGHAPRPGTSRARLTGRAGRSPRSWSPLLDGPLAARAIDAVHAIAQALRVPPPAAFLGNEQDQVAENASLAGGRAGLAILYSYLARAGLTDRAVEAADEFLDDAARAVADVPMPPSLYAGFTGVVWAVAHLHALNGQGDEDLNEDVDEALHEYLTRSPWTEHYDLVSGLVGIGVYALERLPARSAAEMLALVVDRLHERAERRDGGITWLTPADLLPDHQRAQCPQGHFNLGLAHGVPGVIALLGGACAAGVARSKARRLLDGAVTWLLSQRLAADAGAAFPFWTVPGGAEAAPARSAWCYGDPGIAASLLAAARAARDPSSEREALVLARRAATRPPDQAGVEDAGLCHGAAGLEHIFNRLQQSTEEPRMAKAARFWFTKALDMRQPGKGIGGYGADPGLLTGAAGIALALLAAVSPVEPAWDRMLLLSLPARRAPSGRPRGRSRRPRGA